jgi:sugar transferase EpsL
VGLIVSSPLLLATAAVVLRALGPPLLICQRRAGRGGKPLVVPKFRTMTDERDEHGEPLADDERLTHAGRMIRATSLDELPQLWSVLKGDMSLIGPRPLPLEYVPRYGDRQRRRLEARPGLTGWAQVNGRNALSWPDKLELDVWYVENASWKLDLRILWLTVRTVASREGVSAVDHPTMREFTGET